MQKFKRNILSSDYTGVRYDVWEIRYLIRWDKDVQTKAYI